MANCNETYTGKQCVDNEEAEKIFTFLEDQMNNFSAQFYFLIFKVLFKQITNHLKKITNTTIHKFI